MGCWKVSNMEFLDPKEAKKFKKEKWIQYCGTPCSYLFFINQKYSEIIRSYVLLKSYQSEKRVTLKMVQKTINFK